MILLLLMIHAVFGADSSLKMKSEEAIFDGNGFLLKGKILISHEMGQLTADKGDTPHPSLTPISFYEDVELKLKNGFSIRSKKAKIDHKTLTIYFEGAPLLCSYEYQNQPILLKAKRAKVTCHSSASLKNLSTSQIHKLEFFDDIALEYQKKISLHVPYLSIAKKALDSPIILEAKSDDLNLGKIRFGENEIASDSVKIDLSHQIIETHLSTGYFKIPFQSQDKKITFACERISLDIPNRKMTLKNKVTLEDPNIASLATDHMELLFSEKKIPQSVIAQGKNKIYFRNNRSSVLCEGSLILDIANQTVATEAVEESFVYFQNPEMTLSAQKGFFAYELAKRSILPRAIELSGNIRFMINAIQKAQGYGVADRFSYIPSEKKLILAPEENKQVLFWTDDESIKLSAKEIHIVEDAKTQEKRIEGKGDMRFTFTYDEEELYQSLFSTINR